MDKSLVLADNVGAVGLIPSGADKHLRYRLAKFSDWLEAEDRGWTDLDLVAYRDHLLQSGYARSTVTAHLSTVRGRYQMILRDNGARQSLYDRAGAMLRETGQADSPANRSAVVGELVTRIENAIDPKAAPVRKLTSQDRPDAAQLRLTREQANALMATPGVVTLRGLRDTAIIALMLCTGIREAELSALEVRDLRQSLGGELALHVREGKGAKERLIPYGDLDWVLIVVDAWLEAAGITEGFVFRGYYKSYKIQRPGPLSVRAIGYVLGDYPIATNGNLTTAKPHDLRRTYARRLYDAGMDLVAIQQNLGHADLSTTLTYIGALDASKRKPGAVYQFDLSRLADRKRLLG